MATGHIETRKSWNPRKYSRIIKHPKLTLHDILSTDTSVIKEQTYAGLKAMTYGQIKDKYNKVTFVLNTISECFDIQGFDIELSRYWYYRTMLEKQFIAKYLNEKDLLHLIIEFPAIWLSN